MKAFDTLFNKRDYKAAEEFWSANYIQHSAHIPPGREGLFGLIRNVPATLRYEPGVILADKDFVIVHGRFSGIGGPRNWIAADVVRIADGVLAEHWDVIQDEATREESQKRSTHVWWRVPRHRRNRRPRPLLILRSTAMKDLLIFATRSINGSIPIRTPTRELGRPRNHGWMIGERQSEQPQQEQHQRQMRGELQEAESNQVARL